MPLNCVVFAPVTVYAPAPKPVSVYVPEALVVVFTFGEPEPVIAALLMNFGGATALAYVTVPEIEPPGVPVDVAVGVDVAVEVDVAVGVLVAVAPQAPSISNENACTVPVSTPALSLTLSTH